MVGSALPSNSTKSKRKVWYALIVVVVLLILISSTQYAFNHLQSGSATSISTTTLSIPSGPSQVATQISQLALGMKQLGVGRNFSAVLQFYTNSSAMALTGNITSNGGAPFDEKGSYVGIQSIRSIYSYGFADFLPTPTITFSNLSARSIGPSSVKATFTLFVNGTTALWLGANATAHVEQQWVRDTAGWVISNETWDFVTTWTQSPGIGGVGGPPY